MNRSDFIKLSALRIEEAKTLLDAGRYEGSYYLAGYAVECALKACIAKQTKQHDFPPSKKVVEAVYTHDLEKLMKSAGLEVTLNNALAADSTLEAHWSVVKSWNENYRYEQDISESTARNLYTAMTDHNHGVLTWLKKYW